MGKGPVTQEWTHELTFMQQSVLLTAVRGPDGVGKYHSCKLLVRWLRRCVLRFAWTGEVLADPTDPRGGSFTGPSLFDGNGPWTGRMFDLVSTYLDAVDELPHHFQLHFMHAAEIIGYKHPDPVIREWWHRTYCRLVNDLHLLPEDERTLDQRLGDTELGWRQAEKGVA